MPRPERPVDPFAGPVEQFAFDLRKLREKAGTPGYRELGRLAHYSATTLADAARGHKLPTLAVTLGFVRACGGDEAEWERRWRELNETFSTDQPAEAPYVGLAAFSEHDAHRFFGRERLVVKLDTKLAEHRVVLVTGPSGSGKSSLLRAGLLATTPGTLITPGAHPEFPAGAELLVIDQFEELFTLCHDTAAREAFIERIVSTDARVVIGLRADFYGHLAQYPGLADAIEDSQVLVGPMTTDELRRAVVQPAVAVGCTLETGLVTRLIADATGEPGVLPHVSHALLETWRRRRGNTLTLTSYHQSGGIARAIAQTAEDAYNDLDADRRDEVRRLLLRLISPGDGTEDTKRRVHRAELGAAPALERLVTARLVTLDDDAVEISHEAVIRSWPRLREWISEDREGLRVHRRLTAAAIEWDTHGRGPDLLYRSARLSVAADWAATRPGELNPLEQAFLDASADAQERERTTERRRTRNLRRLVACLTALLVIAATTTVVAIRARQDAVEQGTVAMVQKVVAEAATLEQSDPALAAQLRLAAYRLAPLPAARDGLLSTFAAPFATRITAHTETTQMAIFRPDDKVLATAGRDHLVILWDTTDRYRPVELGRLTGHTDVIHHMDFSADGRLLATASWDGTARLWDVSDPRSPREAAKLGGHDGKVQTATFVPGSPKVITTGTDHTIRLWDIAEPLRPKHIGTLEGHGDTVHGAAVSRDGHLLATASWDGSVRLWDIAAGRQITVVDQIASEYESVAVSPDGRTLAAAGPERVIKLWDIGDPAHPAHLSTVSGHEGLIHALAFSPDGTKLLSGSHDRSARLWDVRDLRKPVQLAKLPGHTDVLWSAAFSRDGREIVTASDDRTVRVDHLDALTVSSHTDVIRSAVLDPRDRYIATASEDGTARVLRPDGTRTTEIAALTTSGPSIGALANSPDGNVLLASSTDGVVTLWDMTDPAHPRKLTTLPAGTTWTSDAAFSGDGRLLATADADGTLRLWDVTDPSRPRQTGHTAIQQTDGLVTVTLQDRLLAAASDTKEVALFDVTDPAAPARIHSFDAGSGAVSGIAMHGHLMAVAGADQAALWDIGDPSRPRHLSTLTGHNGPVQAVSFNVSGRRLATTGNDATAKIWDIGDPEHPRETGTFHGHTDRVWAPAFSADDRTLTTASADHTVRRWDTDVERVAARICSLAYPRLTEDDWRLRFPGLAFEPPC